MGRKLEKVLHKRRYPNHPNPMKSNQGNAN